MDAKRVHIKGAQSSGIRVASIGGRSRVYDCRYCGRREEGTREGRASRAAGEETRRASLDDDCSRRHLRMTILRRRGNLRVGTAHGRGKKRKTEMPR